MLGTLIFEGGGEQDCLRLLVGQLPKSRTGPAATSPTASSLPLSPHYARLLAELAKQRGFDGYLLNFECPLRGGVEQTRALAAWITLLQHELKARVGEHAESIWYDSVVFTGQLAWQDRLNSLNLPFFLSSSSLFSNYTWRNSYPSLTAQYFLTLDPTLTGNQPKSHPHVAEKTLREIYMGVDVWGRGSHGNGGFGSYKAISHIAPDSLGLSVAIFGQAWTWETEQDKPGWTWDSWWNYERKLWAGPIDGQEQIIVPEMPPPKEGESPCEHGAFVPLSKFFSFKSPPNPTKLAFHTTFSPGVGRKWFVNGVKVFERAEGWTDVDKQTSMGDLVWPKPLLAWEGDEPPPEDVRIPEAASAVNMDDAWNGGSSLRLTLSDPGAQSENAAFRCVWLPIQSLSISPRRSYEASVVYKIESGASDVDLDISLSVKSLSSNLGSSAHLPEITGIATNDTQLNEGWVKLAVGFRLPTSANSEMLSSDVQVSLGLAVAIVAEDPSQPLHLPILVGRMNVYPTPPPGIPAHKPLLLWADLKRSPSPSSSSTGADASAELLSGTITWEIAASLPPLLPPRISSPEDPVSAWPIQPSAETWFPTILYANVYALPHGTDGAPGRPEDAVWLGTSGYEGMRNTFSFEQDVLKDVVKSVLAPGKVRFYIQGVTERGEVLAWTECVFVDA